MTAVNLGRRVYITEGHEPTDWWLIGAMAVSILSAIDITLTRYLLLFTDSREGNSLMARLVLTPWAPVVKTVVPGVIGWGYVNGPRTPALRCGLRAAVVLYVLVVVWNLHWLVLR